MEQIRRQRMKTSKKGLDLIKQFEGCHLKAYLCPAGKPTIGYGHVKGVKIGQTITQEQADEFLVKDVVTAEKTVMKYDSLYHWTQNEFDALVSFVFNLGPGWLPTLLDGGRRTKKEISNALLMYDKARVNGVLKPLTGLTRRRKAEKALFDGQNGSTPVSTLPVLKRGTKGANVTYAQKLLTNAGYGGYVGKIDGIFGIKTENAVREFQADYIDKCKIVDGIIGEKTWEALKNLKL